MRRTLYCRVTPSTRCGLPGLFFLEQNCEGDSTNNASRCWSSILGPILFSVLTLAVLCAMLLVAARPAQAQSETVLYNFCSQANCTDGTQSAAHLTPDGKGNFYGTTGSGGTFDAGTVFEFSPNGSGGWNETVLYSFCSVGPNCEDGGYPGYAPVILDSAGNLYGTGYDGGANGFGVVFELSPGESGWTESVLYSFANGTDGAVPNSGVIMDASGNLYGTTPGGGTNTNGTVFELSPSGGGWTEQVIYNYVIPGFAGLTMDAGNIFGATFEMVYELSPNGSGGWTSTVIHDFAGAPKDGEDTYATPVLDQAGNLYGTTLYGGASNYGAVYKLSPGKKGKWTEKLLYSFKNNGKDGLVPYAAVVLDAAGNVYGTTTGGGTTGDGTVFELVAPVGKGSYKEKILWNFNVTDGYSPEGSLILDGAGNLYGTTIYGGTGGTLAGVVFEVNPSAAATVTKLISSPNPSTSGQVVTFTAVVDPAPPGGETVTFMEGTTQLGTGTLTSGSAGFMTSTLPVGASTITAVYGGDLNFGPSTSNTVKQVVKK